MIKRLFLRSLVFLLLTILAFSMLEFLVYLGHSQISDINERFPEIMRVLMAVGIQGWGEISIMWFRVLLAPSVDVQQSANTALLDPKAAATLYAAHQFGWAVRMGAFLFLYWLQGAPA